MSDQQNLQSCAESKDTVVQDASKTGDELVATIDGCATEKRPYAKPVLRRFTQIDYVTAYASD